MAVFEIPVTQGIKSFELQVPLDGRLFRLVFNFNERDTFWYFNLYNALDGSLIRAGIKIVAEWDLFRLYQDSTRPDGSIVPVSQGTPGTEARSLEQLGKDLVLTYSGES